MERISAVYLHQTFQKRALRAGEREKPDVQRPIPRTGNLAEDAGLRTSSKFMYGLTARICRGDALGPACRLNTGRLGGRGAAASAVHILGRRQPTAKDVQCALDMLRVDERAVLASGK